MKNTFKNHVLVVFDRSSSMGSLIKSAVQVFNNQIDYLRNASLTFDQETRVSFYSFSNSVECLISDVDVARPIKLEEVHASGMTALIDAATLAINDAKETPQKYGDHSFVLYLITDGEENNSSHYNKDRFQDLVSSLPNNFTVTALVPNNNGVECMRKWGVPAGNIDKWEATQRGVEEVGKKMEQSMDNFFRSRSMGHRASTTMFSDLRDVKVADVNGILNEIPKKDTAVFFNGEERAVQIRPLVEQKTGKPYQTGSAFYQLVKTEHIQPQKEIVVYNKKSKKFFGGKNARKLLNLPDQEVKVAPSDFGDWIVYVQSTSVNRNVIPKQNVLVLK